MSGALLRHEGFDGPPAGRGDADLAARSTGSARPVVAGAAPPRPAASLPTAAPLALASPTLRCINCAAAVAAAPDTLRLEFWLCRGLRSRSRAPSWRFRTSAEAGPVVPVPA